MPQSLNKLTDKQLHERVNELCRREQTLTLAIIDHLIEVERRKLHLKLAYSSMFSYCTESLGYSGSAASRRINAARSIRRFPKIRGMLEKRKLTLSTLAVVARDLTPQNAEQTLESICGKSARDAEKVLARLRGAVPVRESIRPFMAVAPVPAMSSTKPDDHNRVGCKSPQVADNTEPTKRASRTPPLPPPTEQRFRFEFAGSEAFMRKYQKAAALLSNKLSGKVTIEGVFEALLDDYIERHAPERRAQRRARVTPRERKQKPKRQTSAGSRHIPAAVRDRVYTHDGARCTFVSSDGTRCSATRNLHVDHVKPYAMGGGHDPANLRLLCAAHNRLMAERAFGKAHMARFLSRARE